MSLKRFNARRDANEKELVAAARAVGIRLWQLDTPCDFMAVINGVVWPVEIKTAKGKLTPAQEQFVADMESAGGHVLIWRTVDDVLASVGQ
jgi:hypothetical protein